MMVNGNVRLHISPFTPDSASSIIPPNLSSLAENISFHSIRTFPEKNFGYVDLPRMEAEKLKKKLHGSILKGKKIHVEEARPQKRSGHQENQDAAIPKRTAPDKSELPKSRQDRKDEQQATNAFQMPENRKVKRGWTEPRRKERRKSSASGKTEPPPSKYTEKSECLFRSQLPQNKAEQKEAPGRKEKKKGSKSKNQVLVHEFQKSTSFPSFLRSNTEASGATPAAEFVEGQGWIDEKGNVVERAPEPSSRKSNSKKRKATIAAEECESESAIQGDASPAQAANKQSSPNLHNEQADDETSSSGTDSTSSSGTDSDSDEDSEDVSQSESEASTSTTPQPQLSQLPTDPPAASEPSKPAPHPLEALFKRPPPPSQQSTLSRSSMPKPSLEISTSFSFFDPELQDEEVPKEPLTPFSSQDRRFRSIRSAAPTPDTAAPSRTSYFPEGSQPESASDENDDDDEMATPVRDSRTSSSKTGHDRVATSPSVEAEESTEHGLLGVKNPASSQQPQQQSQSEFVQWFYDHRGENNRLWKRRRREAAKEKRREENRRDAKRARRR